MTNKLRWLSLTALLSLLLVLSFGCAQNPRGSYGPTWDVAFKIPGVKEQDVLKDSLNLKGFSTFGYDITNSSNIKITVTGTENEAVQQEVELDLPKITLNSGLVSMSAEAAIADTNDFNETLIDPISFGAFSSMTLSGSSGSTNQFEVTLTNKNQETMENTIDDLEIELRDSSGNFVSSAQFSDVAVGAAPTKNMDLADKTLKEGMKLAVVGSQSSGPSTFSISINSTKLEITKVEGLDSTEFNNSTSSFSFSENLEIGEQATISDGGIKFDLIFPENSNLTFNVTNFALDGTSLTDTDPVDGYRDIGSELNLNSSFALDGDFGVKSGATEVNYDTTKSITMDTGIFGTIAVGVPEDVEVTAEDHYLVYKLTPEKFDIDDDTLDRIDKGLKEADLVTVSSSELPAGIVVELYVDEGDTSVYDSANKVGEIINISSGSNEHKFKLDKETRDKFRGGNTYLGVKIKLGEEGDLSPEFSESETRIDIESYGVLETKVNSSEE